MTELVWITGASSGIGRAVALELARRGHTVLASARRADRLLELAGSAPQGHVHPLPLDVRDRVAVADAVARAEHRLGPVGTALLNAGISHVGDEAFDADGLARLFAVNVGGVANGIAAVLPGMLARRRGRLMLVASLAGYRGLPRSAAYGASKAAVIALAESLRLDLHPHGIIVQVVNPGFVRTPMTDRNDFPMPMLVEPEMAARRIADALRHTGFEVAFPQPFAAFMKIAATLPHRVYFPLVRAVTRRRR